VIAFRLAKVLCATGAICCAPAKQISAIGRTERYHPGNVAPEVWRVANSKERQFTMSRALLALAERGVRSEPQPKNH
jgi:hypothetical protein